MGIVQKIQITFTSMVMVITSVSIVVQNRQVIVLKAPSKFI